MTAYFREQRWGRAAYDREVSLAFARCQRLVAGGADRPLAPAGSVGSRDVGGRLVYAKGMLIMHSLRNAMGDREFFAAIMRFTTAYWLRPATTEDFLSVMTNHLSDSGVRSRVDQIFAHHVWAALPIAVLE